MLSRPWLTAFLLRSQVGKVRTHAGTGHDHGDGADGADFRAEAVADALVSVDDDGLAAEHCEDVALRTDHGACSAANTVIGINVRMLGLRTVRTQIPLFRCLER